MITGECASRVYNALMHQHIEPGTKAAFDALRFLLAPALPLRSRYAVEAYGLSHDEDVIDVSRLHSHLQRKLFEEDGIYHPLWIAMQDDPELTAVVRSRQLHIYRNGKKVLVLAGKAAPKIIREDRLCELVQKMQ